MGRGRIYDYAHRDTHDDHYGHYDEDFGHDDDSGHYNILFIMFDQMSAGAELGSWEDGGSSNTAGWHPEDNDLGEVLRWLVNLYFIIMMMISVKLFSGNHEVSPSP